MLSEEEEAVLYKEIGRRIRKERIEAGRQRLPLHTLYAIARALGVSVSLLQPRDT